MYRPRVIPVLLFSGSGLVKTTKFKNPRYIGDPINAVKVFNDLKADELIFLDISASKNFKQSISIDLIKQVSEEAYMPFSVGGGLKNIDQVRSCIANGAEKVVINTHATKDPNFITECATLFGSQSIIVSIDVKRNIFNSYKVYCNGGKQKSSMNIIKWAKKAVNLGAGEILINSIDQDGTMQGYDINLISKISNAFTVPVIACGGAGSNADLKDAYFNGRASALAAGSLFIYHGARNAVLVNYPENKYLNELFKNK